MGIVDRITHVTRRAPAAALIAAALATVLTVSAGAMVTVHSASNHIASAALGKLGSNPQDVLNKIADSVVKKLSGHDGALGQAQQEIVDRITGVAAEKFKGVDPSKMLTDIKGEVVAAGLGKLDGVNTQQIVDKVTSALIAQAMAQVNKIDLKALVAAQVSKLDPNAIVNKLMSGIDVNKLVKEELDKVDINAIIEQAVQQQLAHAGLLGTLLGGR